MQRRVAAFFVFAFVSAPLHVATAASLPEIRSSASNAVPECVTPGRLLEFLKSRNPELNARFDSVPSEYMRLGEQLGVRWDFAFYQMILETGALSYRRGNRSGDVRATQNNFAGLGATGGGAPGESFKDVPTGVRAHLEHLLLYSGEKLDSPVADRTRKVQEWGVLTKWQAGFSRPITFSDLAAQWAPGSNTYARMLDGISERFVEFCEKPDPRPELVAAVRRELRLAEARAERPSGEELARRALAAGKAEENVRRSGLGVQEVQVAAAPSTAAPAKLPPMPFKVLNAPPEADKLVADTPPPADTAPMAQFDATPKADAPAKSKATAAAPPAASKTRNCGQAAVQGRLRRRRRQAARRGPACSRGWPEVPRVDRELRRPEGADHPLGNRQGGQLHRARRQRGRREARGGRLHLRLRQGRGHRRRVRQPGPGARQGLRALPRRLELEREPA